MRVTGSKKSVRCVQGQRGNSWAELGGEDAVGVKEAYSPSTGECDAEVRVPRTHREQNNAMDLEHNYIT